MANFSSFPDYSSDFIIMFGEFYNDFGLPALCGWIEALLTLSQKPLTQQEIAQHLSNIIKSHDKPTSISSVNRALKIFEKYNYLHISGTRKIGYQYSIPENQDMFHSMFEMLIDLNLKFEEKLYSFRKKMVQNDDFGKKLDKLSSQFASFHKKIERFFDDEEKEKEKKSD